METACLEKEGKGMSWKVLILTINLQNNTREGGTELGFLQHKITSVSQGNFIWWQEEGTS